MKKNVISEINTRIKTLSTLNELLGEHSRNNTINNDKIHKMLEEIGFDNNEIAELFEKGFQGAQSDLGNAITYLSAMKEKTQEIQKQLEGNGNKFLQYAFAPIKDLDQKKQRHQR